MCSPAQGVVPIVLQRVVRLLAATVERKTSPKRNGARGVEYGVTTQAADVMISTMFYCGVERKKKSSRTYQALPRAVGLDSKKEKDNE